MQWSHFRIKVWISVATLVVVADNLFECLQAAIMHVWRCPAALPQRRRLKAAPARALVHKPFRTPCNSCVVQLLICEVRPHMTRNAIAFAAEHLQSVLFLRVQCPRLTIGEAVERRIAREQRPYKARQCRSEFRNRDARPPRCFL